MISPRRPYIRLADGKTSQMMTAPELAAVENLTKTLDCAARLIDTLSRTLLNLLDDGARDLLPTELASEFEALIADAGAQADGFREVVHASRDALGRRQQSASQERTH